jgi:hypothetical protein
MTPLYWTTLIITLFIIFFVFYNLFLAWKEPTKEGWQNYEIKPFNYVWTGSNPMNFDSYRVYRKPYNYPFQFYKSYPVPAMQYTGLLY